MALHRREARITNPWHRIPPVRTLQCLVFGFALLQLFAGCASQLSQADRAFARGEYEQAAEMYEMLVAGTPELTARMQEARRRAFDKRLDRFESSKPNVEAALAELSAAFELREEWPTDTVGATARLNAAVQWLRPRLALDIDARLAIHRPRAAQRLFARRFRPLRWPELIDLRAEIQERIHAEAIASCAALELELASSPFVRQFAATYCKGLEAPWPQESHVPYTISRFDVDVHVDGLTAEDNERLEAELGILLRKTPWYSPSATDVGRAQVEGSLTSDFFAEDVVVSAPYSVRIPYLDTESYQEPYDESYLATEYYTVSVPHTVWSSESYSCGTFSSPRTCSRQTSHTEHRSESRSRLVTRHRTAYRTKQRIVTRYREEHRTHEYQARKHHGRYAAAWRVAIEGPGWPSPLPVQFRRDDAETAIEHDETFEPADLVPSHPRLRSHATWVDQQIRYLARELFDAMTNSWTHAFCAKGSYDAEAGARCVYGDGDDAPIRAKDALRSAFHGDLIDFVVPTR